jgi:UDP-N-acetylmuramate dehydrogenase
VNESAETLFAGADVAWAVPLAPLTTLRVGPVASRVITCRSTEQVVTTLLHLDAEAHSGACGLPLVLAGGSNLVIADTLTDLTVVRLAADGISVDGNILRAEAGAVWDDVVVSAIAAGLGGLECLSGIPGTAGATPVQNVGAYGTEVAETITRVRLLDRRTSTVRWVPARDLHFGYRTSVLKHGGAGPQLPAVVLEVEFALDASGRSAPLRYGELIAALDATAGDRVDPTVVREAVLRLRAGKGMVLDPADHDTWSVGSFFTNPVVAPECYRRLAGMFNQPADRPVPHYPAPDGVKLAAGWLVEQAGFGKGYPHPGTGRTARCRLSTKHALAVTNRGGATAADVMSLARAVRDGVRDMFDITLTPEPVLVGCAL